MHVFYQIHPCPCHNPLWCGTCISQMPSPIGTGCDIPVGGILRMGTARKGETGDFYLSIPARVAFIAPTETLLWLQDFTGQTFSPWLQISGLYSHDSGFCLVTTVLASMRPPLLQVVVVFWFANWPTLGLLFFYHLCRNVFVLCFLHWKHRW